MIARFQTQLKSSSTTRGFSSELCSPGCSSEWKKSSWELECCHFKTCTIVIGALTWPILKQMVYTPWTCMQPWSFRRYHCKLLVCSTDDIRRKKVVKLWKNCAIFPAFGDLELWKAVPTVQEYNSLLQETSGHSWQHITRGQEEANSAAPASWLQKLHLFPKSLRIN